MAKNTKLKNIARKLRQNMTEAEKVLWLKLRRHNLGVQFRRQMPFVFGNYKYIADFCCSEYKLIIEVDGGIHNDPEISQLDNFRDDVFIDSGYKVLRFKNNEVIYNIDKVIKKIKDRLRV
ncbi:endonuclease domain-containing protein [Patescibacteria group bacterium]